jgi:hypothetical protein
LTKQPLLIAVDPISTTWTNSDITITFAATDADSGISKVYFDNGTLTVDSFDISTATDITSSLSGGKYSFLADANDDYTILAVDDAGNKVVDVVTISKIDKTVPAVTVDPISTSWTNSDITVSFTATDVDSGISKVYYKVGSFNVDTFGTGTEITSSPYSFTADANGAYTILAVDDAGNKVVDVVTISTIDKTAPVINTLNPAPASGWTNKVDISFTVTEPNGLDVFYKPGSLNADTFGSGGIVVSETSGLYSFSVTANGDYTVLAIDDAGNKVVATITISNIDTVKPTISVSLSSSDSGYSETLSISATDTNGISEFKWAKGNYDETNFPTGSETLTDTGDSKTVYRSGNYSFFAKDAAGNVHVEVYEATSIHTGVSSSAPILIKGQADIQRINEDLAEDNDALYYQMQNDIAFTDASNWVPVGSAGKIFDGNFDGNGKNITGLISKADVSDGNIVKFQSIFGPSTGKFEKLNLSVSGSNNYFGNAFTTTPQTASFDYCMVNNEWVFSPDCMAAVIAEIEAQVKAWNSSATNTFVADTTLGYMRSFRYSGGNWNTMFGGDPVPAFRTYMNTNAPTVHNVFKDNKDIWVTDTYTNDGIIDFIHFVAPLNAIVSQHAPQQSVPFLGSITVYSTYEQDDLVGWAGDLQSYYGNSGSGIIGQRNAGVFSQEDVYADVDAVNIGVLIMNSSSHNTVDKNVSVAFLEYYQQNTQNRFEMFIENMDTRAYAVTSNLGPGDIKTIESSIIHYTTYKSVISIAKWQIYPSAVSSTDTEMINLRKEFGQYIYTQAGLTVPAAFL